MNVSEDCCYYYIHYPHSPFPSPVHFENSYSSNKTLHMHTFSMTYVSVLLLQLAYAALYCMSILALSFNYLFLFLISLTG